ncbi:hypothetical protein [uncultured Clostridium sp.]|uniref:hypothetical protein n=1 Tax=uncultured Clostridium sp. TaxID=59620 RepID=UPI0025FFE105|nr:hypothetical protein [uncultured Clostridium sp.]
MPSISNNILLNISRGYYKYIGEGSSRIVYDLGNRYVLKVAKNSAGIAQNKSEYKISSYDETNLFAKIVLVDDDFKFVIMEKATKLYSMYYVFDYFGVDNKTQFSKLYEIQKIMIKYNLVLGDLLRKSSWGMLRGRPVIIDYGYTNEVRKKYYS